MKRNQRTLACLVLFCTLLCAGASHHAQAIGTPPEESAHETVIELEPRFDHLSRISASLTFSSLGRANCGGSFTTYDEYDSSMTMVLQRLEGTRWVDVKDWSESFSGSGVKVLDKGYYVSSGYSYRVSVTVNILDSNGNSIETVTCDSPIKEY